MKEDEGLVREDEGQGEGGRSKEDESWTLLFFSLVFPSKRRINQSIVIDDTFDTNMAVLLGILPLLYLWLC